MEAPTTTTVSPDGVVTTQASAAPVIDKGTPSTETQVTTTEVKETPVSTIPDDDKVSTDDFQAVIDSPTLKAEPKKTDTTKTVVPVDKKEDKKPDTTVTQTSKPDTTKTTVRSDGKEVPARDYEGLPDTLVDILKKTDNNLYDHLKPLIAEYRDAKKSSTELSGKVTELQKGRPPENYQEHPLGYILSPEFASASKDLNEAQVVYNHWKQQFDNVEQGALKYNTIVRDTNGNLVLGSEVPADAGAKSKLLGLLNWSQQQASQREAKVSVIQEAHKTKYQEGQQWLQNASKQWFANILEDNHPLQPQIKAELASYPPVFRNNPMAKPLATAIIMCVKFADIIKTLQENGGKIPTQADKDAERLKKTKEQEKEAGPTAAAAVTATATGKDEDVSMEDFDKVLQG
jgi:hypothetical protein